MSKTTPDLESRETLIARLEFLKEEYMPTQDCIESGFKCDFRIDDDTEQCTCEWALSKERQQYLTKTVDQ